MGVQHRADCNDGCSKHTSMYDAVFIIKVNQTLQHCLSDFTNDVNVNGAVMPIDVVQRSINVASARVLRVIFVTYPASMNSMTIPTWTSTGKHP